MCFEKIISENTNKFFTKKPDLKNIDQFLSLEKIRSENTDQFLVFIKEFLLAIVDFET